MPKLTSYTSKETTPFVEQQQFSLLLTPISQTHRRKLTRLVTHSDPLLQKTNPFQTSKKITFFLVMTAK